MWRSQLDTSQTIFALISGALPSAVAVIRLSGPSSFSLADKILSTPLPRERGMRMATLRDPDREKKIDDILALTFVAPDSFTGEDVIEFQCHGSLPIVRKVERILVSLGARPAERGEFSYRALLNGKLAVSDVENLGDVFLARDESDLQKIYSRRDGSLENQIQHLRSELIRVQAILDTAVDFSEEYSTAVQHAHEPISRVIQATTEIIHRYSSFVEGASVPRLVIAGRPNAGKSSLFNGLLCRYRAIVNESPGTTRDVIEEDVELNGKPWKIVDTAGLRETEHEMEREGIELGSQYLAASQFWLFVVDGTKRFSDEEIRLWEAHRSTPHLVVWNKSDLGEWLAPPDFLSKTSVVAASAVGGQGIPQLWETIGRMTEGLRLGGEGPLPTAVQASRLQFVLTGLGKLQRELDARTPPEYLAERNRGLIGLLGGVFGEVSTEDVLDRLFKEFCIGK